MSPSLEYEMDSVVERKRKFWCLSLQSTFELLVKNRRFSFINLVDRKNMLFANLLLVCIAILEVNVRDGCVVRKSKQF